MLNIVSWILDKYHVVWDMKLGLDYLESNTTRQSQRISETFGVNE